MKVLKSLVKIWDFIAHAAWVITKVDELIDQCKIFWEWLFGDDENEPDKAEKKG